MKFGTEIKIKTFKDINLQIKNNKNFDLIVVDYFFSKNVDLAVLKKISKFFNEILSAKGSLWIICKNQILKDKLLPVPLIVSDIFIKRGFIFQNLILWPHLVKKSLNFTNFHKSIVFLTKNTNEFIFNKDLIREKHIWKDVEWGKRKFRYHAKGKDPGNVWLPTIDDNKGKITEHIILNESEVKKRILNVASNKNSKTLLIKSYELDNEDKKFINNSQVSNNQKANYNNNKFKHKIYFRNSKNLKFIKNNSIKLIITSPPYWNLKNYKKSDQIGFKNTYSEYINNINIIWNECFRILKSDGSIWINVNTRKTNNKLINLPLDIINELEKIDLKLYEIIIWHKSSGIPVQNNNLTDRFEYILCFKKSNKQIKNYCSSKSDYLFKGLNISNLNIWNINRPTGSIAKGVPHPAMYPLELPSRIIRRFSDANDLIFDPFLGSGTTTAAAIQENRNSIGCELNDTYKKIMNIQFKKALKFKNSLIEPTHEIKFY